MKPAELMRAWGALCDAIPGGSGLWGYAVKGFADHAPGRQTALGLWAAVFDDLLSNSAVPSVGARLSVFNAALDHGIPLVEGRRHAGHELLDAFNAQCWVPPSSFVMSDEDEEVLTAVLVPLVCQGLPDEGDPWFETLLSTGCALKWFSPVLACRVRARGQEAWLHRDVMPAVARPPPLPCRL